MVVKGGRDAYIGLDTTRGRFTSEIEGYLECMNDLNLVNGRQRVASGEIEDVCKWTAIGGRCKALRDNIW